MSVDLELGDIRLAVGRWRIALVVVIPTAPGRPAAIHPVHVSGLEFATAHQLATSMAEAFRSGYEGALVYRRVMPRQDSPSTFIADVRNVPRVRDMLEGSC